AGSMAGLAAAHLQRAGIARLAIANRTPANAARLAASASAAGVAVTTLDLGDLSPALAAADLVLACTGATDIMLTAGTLGAAIRDRSAPMAVCDLGLPRDVDAAVATLPGVRLIDLASIRERLRSTQVGADLADARALIAEEVTQYLAGQRSAAVTPTVTALRRRAAQVVDAELLRLDARLPELTDGVRDELSKTVRRVVDKLLHTPTVRIKQLAGAQGGADYADALRELFALDPTSPFAVTAPAAQQDPDADPALPATPVADREELIATSVAAVQRAVAGTGPGTTEHAEAGGRGPKSGARAPVPNSSEPIPGGPHDDESDIGG
ncbi:MAG: hypothetical protein ACRDRL_23745, partial [Sciscionella sp.]